MPQSERPTTANLEAQRAAFRGAYSLAWALCALTLTVLFMWVLRAHLEGAGRILGLLAVCLTSSVLLMLFLSGPLKLVLRAVFGRLYPELRAYWRESEREWRQQNR